MQKFKWLISIVLVAFVAASCSTSPTGRSQMIWKSDSELEAQSRKAFNQMRASMPLATDRKKIDFVACVAEAVVAVLEPPYSDIEWEYNASARLQPAGDFDQSAVCQFLRLARQPRLEALSPAGCLGLLEQSVDIGHDPFLQWLLDLVGHLVEITLGSPFR